MPLVGCEFHLPDDTPWPAPRFTGISRHQMWPMGALRSQAPAGIAEAPLDVSPGHAAGKGIGVPPTANVHEPIVLGSTGDECPNTVDYPKLCVAAACRLGPGASQAARRARQQHLEAAHRCHP